MTTFNQLKMCRICPFKKTSAKGWLGDYTPGEVLDAVWKEQHFMCHDKIDYEDPHWDAKLEDKPHCAGALQMAKFMCKLPRERRHSEAVHACEIQPEHLQAKFVDHHTQYRSIDRGSDRK